MLIHVKSISHDDVFWYADVVGLCFLTFATGEKVQISRYILGAKNNRNGWIDGMVYA